MKHIPDLLIVAGALLLPVGVGLVHGPSAMIVAGIECLALGMVLSLRA